MCGLPRLEVFQCRDRAWQVVLVTNVCALRPEDPGEGFQNMELLEAVMPAGEQRPVGQADPPGSLSS